MFDATRKVVDILQHTLKCLSLFAFAIRFCFKLLRCHDVGRSSFFFQESGGEEKWRALSSCSFVTAIMEWLLLSLSPTLTTITYLVLACLHAPIHTLTQPSHHEYWNGVFAFHKMLLLHNINYSRYFS